MKKARLAASFFRDDWMLRIFAQQCERLDDFIHGWLERGYGERFLENPLYFPNAARNPAAPSAMAVFA